MSKEANLPPLPPKPKSYQGIGRIEENGYTADQMQAYARAALAQATPSSNEAMREALEKSARLFDAAVQGNLTWRQADVMAGECRAALAQAAHEREKAGAQALREESLLQGYCDWRKQKEALREAAEIGLEFAREALGHHDQQYQRHPATERARAHIVSEIAKIDAALRQQGVNV